MKAFAQLLDALSFQHGRNGKIALLRRYIEVTPDPDRGWALAALTGDLSLRQAKPALVRGLVMERVDEVLFKLSYDYVGDLAKGRGSPLAMNEQHLARPNNVSTTHAAIVLLQGLDDLIERKAVTN